MSYRIGMEAPTGHVTVDDENLGFRLALQGAPVSFHYAARTEPLDVVRGASHLVEREGVHLLLNFYGGAASRGVAAYANEVGIPYLFPHTFLLPHWEGRYVFSSYPHPETELRVLQRLLAQRGLHRVALIRADGEYGDVFEQALAPVRSVVVASQAPQALLEEVEAVREASPDVVVLPLFPLQSQKVMAARSELGWHDTLFVTAGPLTDEWSLNTPAGDARNVAGFAYFPDPERSDLPGVRAYRAAMAHAHPGHRLNRYSLYGWVYGSITREALQRCQFSTQGANFVQAMESLQDWSTGGITPPISFGQNQHHAQFSGLLSELRDGRFVPLEDWASA